MEIFEKASRVKLRFEGGKGAYSVEDLWDLSLTDLDNLAKRVNSVLKNEGEESFIPTKSSKPVTNNGLRLDILKHIINIRVQEQEDRKTRSERLAQLAELKDLAATKRNQELANQPIDEIEKKIKELEAAIV